MSDPLGIFRRPFSVPRPTQIAGLATLSKPTVVPTVSFPPWRATSLFLLMSAVFTPVFVLPLPTQVAALATLSKAVAVSVSFPPWKFSSLMMSEMFRPVFILPQSTQGMIPGTLPLVGVGVAGQRLPLLGVG